MDAWLSRAARMQPDRVSVVSSEGELTYAELSARARRGAGELRQRGVRRSDRVGLVLAPGEQFAVALYSCLLLGAVAVPVDHRLPAAERAARIAGTATEVSGPLDGPEIEPEPAPPAGATAILVHTSGSTAAPRPVALTYGNWLWSALGSAAVLGLDQRERWLCPLPIAHVGGLSILIRSAIYGTTAVLHERFDAGAVVRELSAPEPRTTMVSLVPTQLQRLLDEGLRDPPALRWALLGGGPIPPALLDRAAAAGVPVATTYGMTEACSQIATRGWPLPGVEIAFADDGELLVGGPNVAPAALGPDGWLRTGDLGALDDRGRLEIIGRKSDTIISGGENVAPAEVEAVLLAHGAVAEAAVHGRRDAEWGEAVLATVVLRNGSHATAAELLAHCASRLVGFKVPKAIEFARSLPRTESGKLLRAEL